MSVRSSMPEHHDPVANDEGFRKRVLCVAAHPDDEVLGVGATLARHANAGGTVVVMIMSEGEEAKVESTRSPHRLSSARAASDVLGASELIINDFPDERLDTVPFIDLIKPIEKVLADLRPEVLYTHHAGDANTDHTMTFKATYAASRPMTRFGASVERFLAFETPSSTEQAPPISPYVFTPNCFVDVESTWLAKLAALECYPSEMVGGIHPRSFEYIEALARMRGGFAGMRFAEAFVMLRERIPGV
jgi:LmbE family N-acetylglucosaminyl deacetylase